MLLTYITSRTLLSLDTEFHYCRITTTRERDNIEERPGENVVYLGILSTVSARFSAFWGMNVAGVFIALVRGFKLCCDVR